MVLAVVLSIGGSVAPFIECSVPLLVNSNASTYGGISGCSVLLRYTTCVHRKWSVAEDGVDGDNADSETGRSGGGARTEPDPGSGHARYASKRELVHDNGPRRSGSLHRE